MDVTEEEYRAILATIKKYPNRKEEIEKDAAASGAATFYKVIAAVLFIGGLLVAAGTANGSFLSFISAYLIYFISGCMALCVAVLFDNQHQIKNDLRAIRNKIAKWE